MMPRSIIMATVDSVHKSDMSGRKQKPAEAGFSEFVFEGLLRQLWPDQALARGGL